MSCNFHSLEHHKGGEFCALWAWQGTAPCSGTDHPETSIVKLLRYADHGFSEKGFYLPQLRDGQKVSDGTSEGKEKDILT